MATTTSSRIDGDLQTALFEVKSTCYLASRSLYVIAGEIKSGAVRAGMQIEISLNSAITMNLDVAGIEFIRQPERELVALTVMVDSKAEADLIDAMNIAGSQLQLAMPAGRSEHPGERST
ncbi:hypothetical protein [Lysobacter brunescens]|uniref:PilZ domain-containing protein n=1 Tax=Lysobacter brunescens TaxID=262323 RepID=A0ABW2Y9W8_9GAMM